ncbi:MAG TPA: cation:proton antiporter, partial [Gemmataceae bacterium]|nr:cation:proton antiporter [Gemmataceae bacterium]
MALSELHSLLLIFTIAVVAPLLCEWVPRIRLPLVVAEIGLGILVGPQVLGWAVAGPTIQVLANFGLAALFFLAGFEIDFPAIRGRPLMLAALGWLASLIVCLGVGLALQSGGVVDSGLIVGAALATTALGTLMPILRDAKELPTRFGAYAVASGAVGEFGPILLIALALHSGEGEHGSALVLMVFFTAIIVAGAYVALKFRPPHIVLLLQEKMHTSAQLPVRLGILVLASLVILARDLGLDAILGAMAAGIVVALASPGEYGESLRHKLEGIGFGFLVPIFFVTTGLRFDLQALISSRSAFLQLPMFLGLFLVVRGMPALLVRGELDLRSRIALGLLSATQLPLVVAIADIGVRSGRLKQETAASLVGAGMASVLLFPIAALALRRIAVLRHLGPSEVAMPDKFAARCRTAESLENQSSAQ